MNSKTLCFKTKLINSPITSGVGCSGYLYLFGSVFKKNSVLFIPSSCGMFVYSDDTSIEASLHLVGKVVCSMRFMNSVVSLMYEGRFCTYGCSHLSTNCDIFSVMLSQLETMGLFPIGVLCIFFRKYNLDVLWFVGGLQYSYQCFRRNLFS